MIYTFTYEELKPLIEYMNREALPSDKHYPGFSHIINRLMAIRSEHDTKRLREQKDSN